MRDGAGGSGDEPVDRIRLEVARLDRSLVRGFLSIFSARIARTIIAVVTLPLIVRALGPGGYGDYGFLISTFALYMIFVSSGVTEGAQKFTAESNGPGWTRRVVGYYVRIAAGVGLLGAVVLALVTWTGVVDRYFGDRFTLYFFLLSAMVVAAQFSELARRFLLAFGRESYSESLRVLFKVVLVGLGLGLVWYGFGVAGMLIGFLVADVLVAVIGFSLVFRQVPLRSVFERVPEEFPNRRLLSFNVSNIGLALLLLSLYHVDVVMVRSLVGSEQTGYYKAALALAEYLWLVPTSLQALLLHSTSELWSEAAHERITDLAARVTRYTTLFTALLTVGIAALAGRFVPLYFGTEFAPAIGPLLWLLPGTIGFAVAKPLLAISQGQGNLKPLLLANGAAALLNVVLNALLIPRFGMVGAAVATSIGYGSMFGFHVVAARHIGYDPLENARILRVAATTVLTIAVVFPLAAVVEGAVTALVVVPPVGLATHVVGALATGAVDAQEVREFLSLVPIPFPSV